MPPCRAQAEGLLQREAQLRAYYHRILLSSTASDYKLPSDE